MPTLVTGATGFLGNNVVRHLLDAGHEVRVLVRESSSRESLAGLDVDVRDGDVREAGPVQRAVDGCQTVVHCAGFVHLGWTGMKTARAINVDGSRNVAQAALNVGARLIHVSSMNALGIGRKDQPADEDTPRVGQIPCPYTITKREGEEVVRRYVAQGLDAVIVNPGFMLGPWDWKPSSGRMLIQIANHVTPAAPIGGCSVSDVRDVCGGIVAAIEKGRTGRQYLLCGHNMTYFELWRSIARHVGRHGPWIPLGPLVRLAGSAYGSLRTRVTGRETDVNGALIRISKQFHYYSARRAQSELSYRYRPLAESIQSAWNWFQQHGYIRPMRTKAPAHTPAH